MINSKLNRHSLLATCPCAARRAQGFTLIEVLVVIVLISILVSMATLSIGGRQGDDLKAAMLRIQQVVRLVHEEAELNHSELAIKFGLQEYQFEVFRDKKWQLINEPYFMQEHKLDERFEIELLQDGIRVSLDEEDDGRILLSSSGEMTPFEIYLKDINNDQRYHMTGNMIGQLVIEGIDEEEDMDDAI